MSRLYLEQAIYVIMEHKYDNLHALRYTLH